MTRVILLIFKLGIYRVKMSSYRVKSFFMTEKFIFLDFEFQK